MTADIRLTSSTITIQNSHKATRAKLFIDGGGFRVDGQGIEGVRPFEIAEKTVLTIERLTVRGGASDSGGGIYNRGTLTLRNCTILDNNSDSGPGGGIYNEKGTLSLERCTVFDNKADRDFGGGIFNGGVLTLINSTISDNGAKEGGGIYNGGAGMVSAANTTVSGNRSTEIGGIVNRGTLTLTNCTVSDNYTWENGNGGILNHSHGELTLHNSIVAYNYKSDCMNDGGDVFAYSSLIQDTESNACGLHDGFDGNIIGEDPRLSVLLDNGGPTKTHALRLGSPAIDAGEDDLAVDPDGNPLATDQRGAWRRWYQVDMGAYELINLRLAPIPER
jgi:hypothetical protein